MHFTKEIVERMKEIRKMKIQMKETTKNKLNVWQVRERERKREQASKQAACSEA